MGCGAEEHRRSNARVLSAEFESRSERRTRFECKPNPTCSLVLPARRVTREGRGTDRTSPMELFVQRLCIFVRRTVPLRSPPSRPTPPPPPWARLRNFRFGLIQFSKSFDFLADVPDFWLSEFFAWKEGWFFLFFPLFFLVSSLWNN